MSTVYINNEESVTATDSNHTKGLTSQGKADSIQEGASAKYAFHGVSRQMLDGEEHANVLLAEKRKIIRDIQRKEECLRKLNMVKKYRTKVSYG